jgi:hypothetical protein
MEKRRRITPRREHLLRSLKSQVVSLFVKAAETGTGIHEVFQEAMALRNGSDLAPSQKEELTSYAWGIRDLYVYTDAHWQLFLDGIALSSEQISELREKGDVEVWNRMRGLMVWRRHLPAWKAFYTTGEQPHVF